MPGQDRRAPIRSVGPVTVTLLAVAAAWTSFGQVDMSVDEGYTRAEARLSFPNLLRVFWGRELNGSLHTVVVWVLIRCPGGDHLIVIRALSTVCLAAAFLLLFPVLRSAGSVWASIAGLAFFAANPLVLSQMVNGRTYALTILLIVVSLRLLLAATSSGSLKSFVIWGVADGVMLYGHFLSGPVIAAELIWLGGVHRLLWRRWLAGTAVTGLLATPIWLFLMSSGSRQHQLAPLPVKSIRDYASGVVLFVAGARGQGVVEFAAVFLVTCCVLLGLCRARTRSLAFLGVSVAAVSVLFAAVAAQAMPSIFSSRYLPLASPGLAVAVTAGLGAVSRRSLASLSAPLLMVALLTSALVCERSASQPWAARHPWTAAAGQIADRASPGGLVTTMVPFEGYAARFYLNAGGQDFIPPLPDTSAGFLAESTYGDRTCPPNGMSSRGPLWVVTAISPNFETDLIRYAECGGFVIQRQTQTGYVRIAQLVQRRP